MLVCLPLAALILGLLVSTSAFAQQPSDKANPWKFGVSIYGYFPNITGQTSFSTDSDNDFEIDFDDYLDSIQFALMGSLDVRKGSWGIFTDAVYMDAGNSASASAEGSIENKAVPVNVTGDIKVDLQSWIWTLTGYYRAISMSGATLDIHAGTRYLDVTQEVDWEFTGNVNSVPISDRIGDATTSVTNWDVIFGFRGRFAFGSQKAWFVPYYLDIGTGDSDLTWQGVAGLGYAFGWGELVAAWRYLEYDMPSGMAIGDMVFSGPVAGVTFRW
jgi:hypothetical protein